MAEKTLTEADIDAIVDRLEERLEDRFFNNLGKGFWGLIWKSLVIIMLVLAAYGAAGSSTIQNVMAKG